MTTQRSLSLLLLFSIFSSGCVTKAHLKKMLLEDPGLVFEVIEKNPEKFMDVAQKASQNARKLTAAREKEEAFKNPKKPKIDPTRAIWGKESARITLVEYSDFQCPYCRVGFQTVEQLRLKHGDDLRIVFKNSPLDMHPMALPAAKYFEAVALQSAEKAGQFYDAVFTEQDRLSKEKEAFLNDTVKKLGIDMVRFKKDLSSEAVQRRIDEDTAESKEFGFTGTPGFLVNGVKMTGARPIDEFEALIQRLLPPAK